MPRLPGQVDQGKTDAILDAAGEIFSAKGLSASIDEVARRAQVSKQTIYNRYGSKAELVRAMVTRRSTVITAPLHQAGPGADLEETLTAYGVSLLESAVLSRAPVILRVTVQAAAHMPEIAHAVFEAGPRATRLALADYLREESERGRLDTPDPLQAAEFFAGMVIATRQLAVLMGVDPQLRGDRIRDIAAEAAARFMRAYAPYGKAARQMNAHAEDRSGAPH
jgi:AcrR family transcriptional regulator